jgi:stearoyl-CoA desaturase (Delta-9 desaturase)
MAKVLQPPAPRVEVVPAPYPRLERTLVLLFSAVPFVALVALFSVWRGISGLDLGLLIGGYLFTGIGITVGFHRYFTHRSFRAVRPLRIMFAIAGSLAVEGSLITWVSDHRRHHMYSDAPGDPHSPHLAEQEGIRGVLSGLWHAHIGWLFNGEKTVAERFAPDLLRDAAMVRIDRAFPWFVTASLVVPGLVGLVATQSIGGAISAFCWGGLVRMFFLHHVTYSINSICHYFGKRPFSSEDESRNNWPLALISFGESWHNNHHAFPSSAVHGLERGQFDLGAVVIRTFERLHLVREVKTPDDMAMARKRNA